jgi:hypothetical protein
MLHAELLKISTSAMIHITLIIEIEHTTALKFLQLRSAVSQKSKRISMTTQREKIFHPISSHSRLTIVVHFNLSSTQNKKGKEIFGILI